MKSLFQTFFLASFLFCGNTFAQAPPVLSLPGQSSQSANHAHTAVELVADVQSVRPGAQFTVGVLMRMDKGWHTYWKNAGDAGLPTAIRWTLPAGFTAGDIQWPLPEKQIETGDILTYGYADENMLLIPMHVSDAVHAGSTVTLKADVSWLECEHVCVPGSASVELKLPVAASDGGSANAAVFERFRSRLPRQAAEDQQVHVSHDVQGRAVRFHLAPASGVALLADSATAPDFYPESLDDITIERTQVRVSPEGATLTVPLSAPQKATKARVMRGVIVYETKDGERRGIETEVPLSAKFLSSLSGPGQQEGSGKSILDESFSADQIQGAELPLLYYFLFAFVGGLLLNIMPCVLPVIALKIFGLVKMAGDHPGRVRKLGWFFSSGIAASFLVLAVLVIVLKAAGQQVGWGFQFQEPLFVVAMSVVVFAFGLSLFGVFEIRPPSAAVNKVGAVIAKTEGTGKGYAASFSEGVFATILATPCTAPFLGTALGFAFAQPAPVILLIFLTVAAGMALPYLLLTARPAWLKFLPRPGAWMETAKQIMGFLMMATLLWLLFILGKQLGMEAVIWTGAFLLTVGVACWMVGRFATLSATRAKVMTVWVAALLVAVGGYWLFMESALDIRAVIAGVPGDSQSAPSAQKAGIAWEPFSLSGLESSLKENRTVFIDFTAEWCLTCKVNERTVMADKNVIDKFKNSGIIPIRADWTNRNPDITRLLSKFGRSGVPFYVIFPAGRSASPIVLPEVITSGMVIDAIDRAAESADAE